MVDNKNLDDNHTDKPTGRSGFLEALHVVGNFIGTHGLAVFLVVFYTLIIYPQSQNERKEWIEEITRVKQMIDPKSRPINYIQADAILRIVTSSFIERLIYNSRDITSFSDLGEFSLLSRAFVASNYKHLTNKFTPVDTSDLDNSKENMYVDFYFENVKLRYQRKPESKEIGIKELDKIHNQIQTVFVSYFENRNIELKQVFEKSLRNNTGALIQLERLNTENGSLDDVWRSAAVHLMDKWLSNFDGTIDSRTFAAIRGANEYVQSHPNYNEWLSLDVNRKMFPKYDVRNVQDIIFTFQNEIEQELINQLKIQTTNH